MTNAILDLTAAFDRSLFRQQGGSVRHLVVRMNAERPDASAAPARGPLNIALAIDVSGSMSGDKLRAAKDAALGLLERLTDEDHLSIVSFGSDVVVHVDGEPVTEAAKARIARQIEQLRTRGSTYLSGGWFAAVDCAAAVAERDPQLAARVILLTDGMANKGIKDRHELATHARELRQRQVMTSALGIGDDYDERMLRELAEAGGGRLHDAELASEIAVVLWGEIDDIHQTVFENTIVRLTAPAGVDIQLVGRQSARQPGSGHCFDIGMLQHGIERAVVFRVRCPPAPIGETLEFAVSAQGRSSGHVVSSQTAEITLQSADRGMNVSQTFRPELAALVAKAWLASIMREVADLNKEGNFAAAGEMADAERAEFARYVRELPNGRDLTRQVELLGRRARQAFSPRMSKELIVTSSRMYEARRDWRGPDKASWDERMAGGE